MSVTLLPDDQQQRELLQPVEETTPIGKYREWQAPSAQTVIQRQQELTTAQSGLVDHSVNHEEHMRQQVQTAHAEGGSPVFANPEEVANICQNLMIVGKSLVAERQAAESRYQGRNYKQGSFRQRFLGGLMNVAKPKMTDEEVSLLFRKEEAKICGEFFAAPDGVSNEPFCVDGEQWVLRQSNQDNHAEVFHYLIRASHVILRRVGYADIVLNSEQLEDFKGIVQASYRKMQEEYAKISS